MLATERQVSSLELEIELMLKVQDPSSDLFNNCAGEVVDIL